MAEKTITIKNDKDVGYKSINFKPQRNSLKDCLILFTIICL